MARNGKSRHNGGTRSRVPTLLAIGGHEDRAGGDMRILQEFANLTHGSKVVVATQASSVASEMWKDYHKAFTQLKLKPVHLDIENRIDALDDPRLELINDAAGIFFTGGDQLAITSKLGGTALCDRMHKLYESGSLVVAGTSAGASVLGETMIVSGNAEESHKIGNFLQLSPGLGFIQGVVIDQHFAQRGRVSRLLGIVAQNPRALGIGIDENTAIVIQNEGFRVVGAGAVYVLDGRPVTHTNIAEGVQDRTISVFDVRMHVLSEGDTFDFAQRRPAARPAENEQPQAQTNGQQPKQQQQQQ